MGRGDVEGAVTRKRHNGHCLTTLGRGLRARTKSYYVCIQNEPLLAHWHHRLDIRASAVTARQGYAGLRERARSALRLLPVIDAKVCHSLILSL